MRIILHEENSIAVGKVIDFLEKNYKEKILKILRGVRLIKLINGDEIKIVTKNYDGLRADVAIGKAAKLLTVASKEENPIWTMKDLEIYLSKIEVNESKDKSSISIKVSVDTTEIDEALKKAKELAEVLERISKLSENIEGLIKLTNTTSKMSCEGKQCWLEDLRTIASVSQPNYDKPKR